MALAGPATPRQTTYATTGGHIVFVGGPITNGRQASTTGTRMTSLTATHLNATLHVYATDTATIANGTATLAETAKNDTTYSHNAVDHAIICGGLNDTIDNLATIITKTRTILDTIRQAYPNARIIVGACPGSIASMSDERISQNTTILNAILAEARNHGALAVNLRQVCGTDTGMQASGIYPNDAGHEALANALTDAIEEDMGEPVDQPVTPSRVYTSALTDWASRQVDATRRREAEKREANRPTGTELGGVTEKLDQLTQAQGVQQVLLEQQQDALKRQQEQLKQQQEQLKRQQDELQKQQGRLDEQQKALKAAQDQLKRQQETLDKQQEALTGVVAEQGGQVNTLKTLTENLQKTDKKIDTIQHTLWENQQTLDRRIDRLDERVQKLENGTSA